jgi:surface antigen
MAAAARVACGLLIAAGALLSEFPTAACADPPSWAPAHGWRRQHDSYYSGYTGTRWDHDYGIVAGRCDRQAIGSVLGGTVGGVIGSQIGKDGNRPVATVLGAVIGSVVGAKIGADLDGADRGCVGHVLELARDQERVTWVNPATGITYLLSPTRGYMQDGRICREFSLQMTAGPQMQAGLGVACQAGDGTWEVSRREAREMDEREHGRRERGERGRHHRDDDD